MNLLRRWMVLARTELRAWTRAPARAALIAVLVALPVAGVVGASIVIRGLVRTPEAHRRCEVGAADLRIERGDGRPAPRPLATLLPTGAKAESVVSSRETLALPGLRLACMWVQMDPTGLAAGTVHYESGRPPGPGEVALSPVMCRAGAVGIGDWVHREGIGRRFRISGVVVHPRERRIPMVVAAADSKGVLRVPAEAGGEKNEAMGSGVQSRSGVSAQASATPPRWVRRQQYLSLPEGADVAGLAKLLRDDRWAVQTAAEVLAAPGDVEGALLVVGAVGLVEAALIIAAAFAIGLRRRQREMGMLAAAGATPGDVGLAVLLSAVVLALLGGVAGAGVGIGVAAWIFPWLPEWSARVVDPFSIRWIWVVAAIALGVVVSVSAAWWPARAVATLPIRVALSGRRPVTGSGWRWGLVGIVLLCIGGALSWPARGAEGPLDGLFAIAGSVFGVLGCGACTPWLLQKLAGIGAVLPLSWRLAVRDAGRFRGRNAPVVTAVLAGMALSVSIAVLISSLERNQDPRLRMREDHLRIRGPGAAEVAAAVQRTLPTEVVAQQRAVRVGNACAVGRVAREATAKGDPEQGWLAVGGPELLAALGVQPSSTAQAPVTSIAAPAPLGIEVRSRSGGASQRTAAAVPGELSPALRSPLAVISEAECARLGLAIGPPPRCDSVSYLVRLRDTVDAAALATARKLAAAVPGTSIDAARLRTNAGRSIFLVVYILSLVTGLLVLGVALALTAVESRADRRILFAVGAPPAVSRSHRAAGAAYLALLGCLLAIPAGLLPAQAILDNMQAPRLMPWFQLLATSCGLPVLAFAGAWCFGGRPRWL